MKTRKRKLLVLNLFKEGPISEQQIAFGGMEFSVTEHFIGWDLETAESLVKKYDGYVDGISLSGVQKKGMIDNVQIMGSVYLSLMRAAVRTPLYLADDVRDFFADWALSRLLKEQPQFFYRQTVLFHCGVITPFLKKIERAGAKVQAGDALLLSGVPILLKGHFQLKSFLRIFKMKESLNAFPINPENMIQKNRVQNKFAQWSQDADVIITFSNLLDRIENLKILKGKTLIIDSLSEDAAERIKNVGVAQVIEFIPEHPELKNSKIKHFSLLAALIDQKRVADDSSLNFDEYILKWLQVADVKPSLLQSQKLVTRRCAFVVHPLTQADIWKTPGLSFLKIAPKFLRDSVEKMAALAPPFYYGSLKGIKSELNGQEVVCDIYALPSTPKVLLGSKEEFVYKKLVQCAQMAHARGASLIGLGAYTKVIGDAGVTVSRRSPIPVTNGNSYSASTTLWAGRVMVEKMGMVPVTKNGNRIRGKAMVIGATGSIGRVSSLLVSLIFEEIVLVATRPDKLLELRLEVIQFAPGVTVKVATNPNHELSRMDLVVCATSNQAGTVLDIEQVKPGAVICDCSRPLDISAHDAAKRPDVMVIESGEVLLPGDLSINVDIGLPEPIVYACLAETVLLALEGRFESFSLSKVLSMEKVKEIYKLGLKHGAKLADIRGPKGIITEDQIKECRKLALLGQKGTSRVPVRVNNSKVSVYEVGL
jgi:predicted amino acid dehydrogenase